MIKVRISPDYVYSGGESQVKTCSICVFDDINLNENMDIEDISDLIVLRDALSAFIDKNLILDPTSKIVKQIKQKGKCYLVTKNNRRYVEVEGGQDE